MLIKAILRVEQVTLSVCVRAGLFDDGVLAECFLQRRYRPIRLQSHWFKQLLSRERDKRERKKSIHQHHTHPSPTQIHILVKRNIFKSHSISPSGSLCVCNRKDERGMERQRGDKRLHSHKPNLWSQFRVRQVKVYMGSGQGAGSSVLNNEWPPAFCGFSFSEAEAARTSPIPVGEAVTWTCRHSVEWSEPGTGDSASSICSDT